MRRGHRGLLVMAALVAACQALTGGDLLDLSPSCDDVADCEDGDLCTDETCVEGICHYTQIADPGTDSDRDGWTCAQGDCDDGDLNVYPEAPELCDGIDNDCDNTTPDADDEPCICEGHAEMVLVPSLTVCVDRYEASQGLIPSVATSRQGVMPWVDVTWDEALSACQAAGKRLCTEEEWLIACEGPSGNIYPYGGAYDPDRCNGEDHGAGAAVATGSLGGCEGGYAGLFDMSGNVWEWTSSCSDGTCRLHGGSWSNDGSYVRCSSGHSAESTGPDELFGFRCCLTR